MAADLHGCVLAILVEDGADSKQVERIRDRLKEFGGRVHLVGQSSPVRTLSGNTLDVDAHAAEISPRYYDGIVIPGVTRRDPTIDNESTIALLQAIAQERRVIGAIGEGVSLLLDAGLLEGRKVACSNAVSKLIADAGGKRVADPVVNDRVIITAGDFAAMDEFCEVFAREIVAYRKRDYVDEVSMESFPGSDAPSNAAI